MSLSKLFIIIVRFEKVCKYKIYAKHTIQKYISCKHVKEVEEWKKKKYDELKILFFPSSLIYILLKKKEDVDGEN